MSLSLMVFLDFLDGLVFLEEGLFEVMACLPLGVSEFFAGLLAGKEGISSSDSSDASEREDVKL